MMNLPCPMLCLHCVEKGGSREEAFSWGGRNATFLEQEEHLYLIIQWPKTIGPYK